MADDARFGFEKFDCAPALRLEAYEELQKLHLAAVNLRLDRIEALMERLERRLWFAVYGVLATVLATAFKGFIPLAI